MRYGEDQIENRNNNRGTNRTPVDRTDTRDLLQNIENLKNALRVKQMEVNRLRKQVDRELVEHIHLKESLRWREPSKEMPDEDPGCHQALMFYVKPDEDSFPYCETGFYWDGMFHSDLREFGDKRENMPEGMDSEQYYFLDWFVSDIVFWKPATEHFYYPGDDCPGWKDMQKRMEKGRGYNGLLDPMETDNSSEI